MKKLSAFVTILFLTGIVAFVPSRALAGTRSLNPQPLPPGVRRVALNPQPLPPGMKAPSKKDGGATIEVNPQPLPPSQSRSVTQTQSNNGHNIYGVK